MILLGDCLERLKELEENSVDAVVTDPPYGVTDCEWDNIVPFEPMWSELLRIVKPKGAICIFGTEPFSSQLRMSNARMFRYDWIWKKSNPSNFAMAKKQPLRYHEVISVFSKQASNYYPVKIPRVSPRIRQAQKNGYKFHNSGTEQNSVPYREASAHEYDADWKMPSSILEFNSLRPNSKEFCKHPTQKPVALCEYLIKTYTKEGETILDPFAGSGSTGVAALKTGRKFIGIEQNADYVAIAEKRLAHAKDIA